MDIRGNCRLLNIDAVYLRMFVDMCGYSWIFVDICRYCIFEDVCGYLLIMYSWMFADFVDNCEHLRIYVDMCGYSWIFGDICECS